MAPASFTLWVRFAPLREVYSESSVVRRSPGLVAHISQAAGRLGTRRGLAGEGVSCSTRDAFQEWDNVLGGAIAPSQVTCTQGEPSQMPMKIPVDTLYYATIVVKDLKAAARNYAEFYGINQWKVVDHNI